MKWSGKTGTRVIFKLYKMSLSAAEKEQYDRHLILNEIGAEGQLKLKNAKVLVIGAGGLGCAVLQYLSAAGVGTIGIIDDDNVDQSNLQRQILYTHLDIGENKAITAAKRLKPLNPFVEFEVYRTRLTTKNVLDLFKNYDLIVDGTDNFSSRYLINDAAVLTDKPVIFGSIFKFEGQLSVFNYKNGPTYRCLFPSPPKASEVPNCSEIGVLGVLPGIIGSLQANEVLKIILGLGEILTGKLLTIDVLSMNQRLFSFKKNPSILITKLEEEYDSICGIPPAVKEISFTTFKNQAFQFKVLDVRTLDEREEFHIKSLHIPLNELTERHHEISQDKKLLVYCKSGVRSAYAIAMLQENGFKNELVNLKGGLSLDMF